MAEKYKRIQDVEEKIHSVKLPYDAWKVFFLIDKEVSAPQISEYLDEDISIIDKGLKRLLSEGLVESIPGEDETFDQEKQVEAIPEEEIPDMTIDEEEETDTVESEAIIEETETIDEELEAELNDLASEAAFDDDTQLDVDLSEDMPDFTEDLISVVEEEDEKPQADEDSLDDLISEDLEIDEEAQLELETEQLEVDEPQIDIEKVEEEQDEEFDVSNLDVDFAEEVSTVSAPEPEKPQPEPKEEKTGAKSVLVIDDSIVIRKMVEIALEDENFKIVTAVSGKDGLALLDEKNPDLIILDLMLPDINGIDLLKTVKASKGIPVIMLSGKDSPQMVEKARAEGADAFLPKPFKDDELVEKIKELIS